eukprot:TRINITY_DN2691_c0_g1_i1.p1 TRINITY_DN2691_c0_g1~~TRINITY_DN2691_c0_g1_i1.p1  ORF type:complete len:508 (+),score=182.61 TRINITY_DN2691_c0_g1_i1:44-1525(+)
MVLTSLVPVVLAVHNVVLVIVDDFRPEVMAKPYNQSYMQTPYLDKFLEESVVFNRAYCQQAVCGPTRNSFLSGRRPQKTQVWNFINSFRDVGPDWVSFPEYFKNHGYTTLGCGKVYHPDSPPNNDQPYSWSQDRPYRDFHDSVGCQGDQLCPVDAPYSDFTDGANLEVALRHLDLMVSKGDPFFLAYGIHKPHLPWVFPAHFWDLYDSTTIPSPKHQEGPAGMPPIAFSYDLDEMSSITAMNQTYDIPYPEASTAFPPEFSDMLRRGYYSAVSWTDYNVGALLQALEDKGVADNTVVALIGDHGWQLGEHNLWGKMTNFELATRVPFAIRVPGVPGGVSNSFVESVDLYPTVASLAGLEVPSELDGVDLSPIVYDPSTELKSAVYSEFPRCPPNLSKPWVRGSCMQTPKDEFKVMGYSVRVDGWRYTLWLYWDAVNLVGDFDHSAVGEELYNHAGDDESDYDMYENANVADDPVNAEVVAELRGLVEQHWRKF